MQVIANFIGYAKDTVCHLYIIINDKTEQILNPLWSSSEKKII